MPIKKHKPIKKKNPGTKVGNKAANKSRLKAITTEAKKIRKSSPKMKWTTAIKQASKKIHG